VRLATARKRISEEQKHQDKIVVDRSEGGAGGAGNRATARRTCPAWPGTECDALVALGTGVDACLSETRGCCGPLPCAVASPGVPEKVAGTVSRRVTTGAPGAGRAFEPLSTRQNYAHCTARFRTVYANAPHPCTADKRSSFFCLHPHSLTAPSAKLGTAAVAEGGRARLRPSMPLDPLYELFHSEGPALVMHPRRLCKCHSHSALYHPSAYDWRIQTLD
jgi:hypothetical protein